MTEQAPTIGIEACAHVVRIDGLHGQVTAVNSERRTFRVQWSDQTASSHFSDGTAMSARLPAVDMEDAR